MNLEDIMQLNTPVVRQQILHGSFYVSSLE
jgi:hypothetical protein